MMSIRSEPLYFRHYMIWGDLRKRRGPGRPGLLKVIDYRIARRKTGIRGGPAVGLSCDRFRDHPSIIGCRGATYGRQGRENRPRMESAADAGAVRSGAAQ